MHNVKKINFRIDGKPCKAEDGKNLIEAAAENGVHVPTLCYVEGKPCLGTCRVCATKVNGRDATGCTVHVSEGMEVECHTPDLDDKRRALIEMMFVERNHFCPCCEKSGRCDLQALAYKAGITVPRFPYRYKCYAVDATPKKFMLEQNRCIMCERCVNFIRDEKTNGKIFSMTNRSRDAVISIDYKLADKMTDRQVEAAVDICPVGAIIKKGQGFDVPIGQRKYDLNPIGTDFEPKPEGENGDE